MRRPVVSLYPAGPHNSTPRCTGFLGSGMLVRKSTEAL